MSLILRKKILTNRITEVIIHKHLRECWNGRQARLRCVWLRRVGSSPISRTKKPDTPLGYPVFLRLRWDSKARPERSEGIKQSRGLFYRAWESPLNLRRIRNGCGSNSNMSGAEKVLVQRTFSKKACQFFVCLIN